MTSTPTSSTYFPSRAETERHDPDPTPLRAVANGTP